MPYADPEVRKAYHKAYGKEWNRINPERAKDHQKRYLNSERGKQKRLEISRRPKSLEYHKKWYREKSKDPEFKARMAKRRRDWCHDSKKHLKDYRRINRLHRYRLTQISYDEMEKAQKGKCALCCKPNQDGSNLHVDHNHKTNQVRGLLCRECNLAVGHIEARGMSLLRLMLYLDPKISKEIWRW